MVENISSLDTSKRPAQVAQWSNHSGAVCSTVRRAQWLGFKQPRRIHLPKNYFL